MKTSVNNIKSLYIHIPFCHHLCDYCDFPKLQYFSFFASNYLKQLEKELENYRINNLETIYIGGGTPTSLDDELFLELLKIFDKYSDGVKEYTIEANPESLTINKLKMMKEHGVNRLSIGVETTDDNILKSINRHHTYQDVISAVQNAKQQGFNNINLDLILGLPNCSISQIKKDIENILSLDVEHISCYSLTVNPHTIFYLKHISEPLSDFSRSCYDMVNEILEKNGFIHYEISNWCKPQYQSRHNLTYWNNDRYYGVGLGASGYIDDIRYTNTKSINEYLKGKYLFESERISLKEEKEYQIILNLRTMYGIDLIYYKEKFNIDLYHEHQKDIDELISLKLLKIESNHLIATYEGMMILDQIILKLL